MTTPSLSLLARRLARRPGYAVAAVLTLALGLGANLTIFSLVRGVLLRPLPYSDESLLVVPYSTFGGERSSASAPDFADLRARARSLDGLAAFYSDGITLTTGAGAEQLPVAYVTQDFFHVLGTPPEIGRSFTSEEMQPSSRSGYHIGGYAAGARSIVISHGLFQRRFGGDRSIVGRTVRVGGEAWTVAGVMPASFDYPAGREAWLPLAFDAETLATQRGAHYLRMVGRLRHGVTMEAATAELRGIATSIARQYPNTNTGGDLELVSLREAIVGRIRPQLLTLQWAVALVLLMATANVASLMLARVLDRRREVALRTALGASRGSLVVDVLGESLLLAGIACLLAIAVAAWLVSAVRGISTLPLPRIADVRLDGAVVAGAAVASLGCAIVLALVASLRVASRRNLHAVLDGQRSSEDRGGLRLRSMLIVGESALAVVLLFGAMLLARSFLRLSSVSPGFDATRTLTFTLGLPSAQYPDPADRRRVTQALMERLGALPGVESAGVVTALPFSGDTQDYVVDHVDGRPSSSRPEDEPSVIAQVVSPGYLKAIGVPVLRGRNFDQRDTPEAPLACLVDERAAARFWPGKDPIGHTLDIGTRFGQGGTRHAGGIVVGVVGAMRQFDLATPPGPTLYVLHDQFPIESYGVAVRSRRPPLALERGVRNAVAALDADLAVANVRPLAAYVDESIAEARLRTTLLLCFGLAALLLATVGLYGVMAFAALQARREVAIRMALGSAPSRVLRRLVGRGLRLGGAGLVLGLLAALPLGGVLRGWLYDLAPQDPWSAIVAVVLLLLVSGAASLGPAWRAARVDLSTMLRD